jgi:hypothetical protein
MGSPGLMERLLLGVGGLVAGVGVIGAGVAGAGGGAKV